MATASLRNCLYVVTSDKPTGPAGSTLYTVLPQCRVPKGLDRAIALPIGRTCLDTSVSWFRFPPASPQTSPHKSDNTQAQVAHENQERVPDSLVQLPRKALQDIRHLGTHFRRQAEDPAPPLTAHPRKHAARRTHPSRDV